MDNPQSEEQLLSQAWNLFAKDDYAGVLNICRSGYAHGVRSYDMVRLMLDSLNKLGKVQEQAEVTLKVLGENQYPPKVAAKLYFRAGLIYQHQEDVAEARRIFEKVRTAMPKISLGTVYRNLSVLKEEGLIREIYGHDRRAQQ